MVLRIMIAATETMILETKRIISTDLRDMRAETEKKEKGSTSSKHSLRVPQASLWARGGDNPINSKARENKQIEFICWWGRVEGVVRMMKVEVERTLSECECEYGRVV